MTHSHRPQYSTETVYTGGGHGPSTGGITVTEQCSCGAVRHTNINGRHQDTGEWYLPGIVRRSAAGFCEGRGPARGRGQIGAFLP